MLDSDEKDVSVDLSDAHQAMTLHEAAVVLNLHAQAVAVQNIRSLIPVILDTAVDNYSRPVA